MILHIQIDTFFTSSFHVFYPVKQSKINKNKNMAFIHKHNRIFIQNIL